MSNLQPVIVRAGEAESQGAFGVSMTMLTVGAQSNGQWLLLEYLAPPRFAGPSPHVHRITTEVYYVLAGTLTMLVEGQAVQRASGGCAYVPPGTTHGFANQADTPAKFLLLASPAGLESDFAELDKLLRQEPRWPPQDMSACSP